MGKPVVTSVELRIPADREQELLHGYRDMIAGPTPDGFMRSELLRSFDGAWRIQTVWRDRDALTALRQSGEPPAALALLERLGAEHTHSVFTVEDSFEP
jgi:heme-degrading monooxygenase HmoA